MNFRKKEFFEMALIIGQEIKRKGVI